MSLIKKVVIYTIDHEELKKEMQRLGITSKEIAEAIHVSTSGMCRYVRGQVRVPEYSVQPIIDYMEKRAKEYDKNSKC